MSAFAKLADVPSHTSGRLCVPTADIECEFEMKANYASSTPSMLMAPAP